MKLNRITELLTSIIDDEDSRFREISKFIDEVKEECVSGVFADVCRSIQQGYDPAYIEQEFSAAIKRWEFKIDAGIENDRQKRLEENRKKK